jgi:hypothetical protein
MPCSHHAPFVALYIVAIAIISAYLGEAATGAALLLSLLTWGFGRGWTCPVTPPPSVADETPQTRSRA